MDCFVETVTDELSKNGKVNLVEFGTFKVAHRKSKVGIDPRTSEKITIKARRVPTFKAGKSLKLSCNPPFIASHLPDSPDPPVPKGREGIISDAKEPIKPKH